VDVRRVTAGGGVAAAVLATVVLSVPPVAVAAGAAAALAVPAVDRGSGGVALSSLAVAGAAALTGVAVAGAATPGAALVTLFAVLGVAGCLAVGLDAALPVVDRPIPSHRGLAPPRGGIPTLLGAWTSFALAATAVLAVLATAAQPFGSLLGARLTLPGLQPLLIVVPLAVTMAAGWGGLVAWRWAGLPSWPLAAGPAALFVAWALGWPGTGPAPGSLLGGSVVGAPSATVLLWATATVTVASGVAGAVAAEDARFRRAPAWVAVAVGPVTLGGFVAVAGGGVFVAAVLAVVPPLSKAFGAVLETADPGVASAFLAAASIALLVLAATLSARAPVVGGLTRDRAAGVGAGCLLVAVALAGASTWATVAAGGLAILAGVLLAAEPPVAPPPRTALSRAGVATLAVGAGTLLAGSLVGLVPRTEPGVGGVLLLAGVAALGLAMR
jgi:hypothetical protein